MVISTKKILHLIINNLNKNSSPINTEESKMPLIISLINIRSSSGTISIIIMKRSSRSLLKKCLKESVPSKKRAPTTIPINNSKMLNYQAPPLRMEVISKVERLHSIRNTKRIITRRKQLIPIASLLLLTLNLIQLKANTNRNSKLKRSKNLFILILLLLLLVLLRRLPLLLNPKRKRS